MPTAPRGRAGSQLWRAALIGLPVSALLLSACSTGVWPFARTGASGVSGDAVQSVTPGGPRFPRNASRFEVLRAADSTVEFARMEAEWVAPGMAGIAVDPAHRDVLVARLEVLSVEGPRATALITGQTTTVDSAHVVLLLPPVQPMWRNKMFLRGVATGAIGVIAAVIVF